MDDPRLIIVMLRQPRLDNPNEMRTDPLWEFGSFGCTGCHRKNLMNPKRLTELNGTRFAFAQNGALGMKLVHITPPVNTLHHGMVGEATWHPVEMPLTYSSAPILINNFGASDVPEIREMISDVMRRSPVAQFASKFRSRHLPLPGHVGRLLIAVYERFRKESASFAQTYVDALPYKPPRVDEDRQGTYRRLRGLPMT
jgi:hypothetical protein